MTTHKGKKDTWKINSNERLSYQSIDIYLKHLQRIKKELNFDGGFFVQSNNSFPQGIGLSSSSSSFSALTACALNAIYALEGRSEKLSQIQVGNLSAKGKLSSRHSFYSPWSMVENDSITGVSFGNFDKLSHVALVVSDNKKRISTAQVLSLLEKNDGFHDYKKNIRKRVIMTHDHITNKNWKGFFECVWEDFNELQTLFLTSRPSFSFNTDKTKALLDQVKKWWDIYGDGPIVSMGMGYVVHLFFRQDQGELKEKMLQSLKFIGAIEGTYDQHEKERA